MMKKAQTGIKNKGTSITTRLTPAGRKKIECRAQHSQRQPVGKSRVKALAQEEWHKDKVVQAARSRDASHALTSTSFSSKEKNRQNFIKSKIIQDKDDCSWAWRDHYLEKDRLWGIIKEEVRDDAEREPLLASYLFSTVLAHDSLERSIAFNLANKLQCPVLPATQLMELFYTALTSDKFVGEGLLADILSTYERDPACTHYSTCLLYYKGFHAVQAHRISHWLWGQGRKGLATALQSRVSETFHVDIHPAAKLGRGIMLDHATGVVIGESAVVGDNVSMLHHVTLGGSGKGRGDRHPKIGNGVLIGAGAVVLGKVHVGHCSKIGAGSVILTDVPPHHVAVGVPARVIPLPNRTETPVNTMDQITFDFDI